MFPAMSHLSACVPYYALGLHDLHALDRRRSLLVLSRCALPFQFQSLVLRKKTRSFVVSMLTFQGFWNTLAVLRAAILSLFRDELLG